MEEYGVSIARACKLMDIHRSYYYYREKKDDTEVEEAIRSAAEYGDGFWKIFMAVVFYVFYFFTNLPVMSMLSLWYTEYW